MNTGKVISIKKNIHLIYGESFISVSRDKAFILWAN